MIGIFKQKSPVNILLVLVLGILIRLPHFREASLPEPSASDGILYRDLVTYISNSARDSAILFAIIAYGFLFIQSMYLNRLVSKHRMMQRLSYLPAISYIVLTALIPEWNVFSAALLGSTFLLLIFSGLFRMYHAPRATGLAYNVGLILGIGSLVYYPLLFFLPWLFIGLMVMRTVRLNEWIICLLGVTSPYYFYSAYLLFTGSWAWDKLFFPLHVGMPMPEQSLWLAGAGFLLLVPFLMGGYYIQENLRKMLIQVRKNWSLVLLYLLFALAIPFVNNSFTGFENWILIAIPFAAFHACTYMYLPQRFIPFIIFMTTLLFIIASQYRVQV